MNMHPAVLLIYTGGTIGMINDPQTGVLKPFDFNALTDYIPELKRLNIKLDSISFEHPLDSSNMTPEVWVKIAEIIQANYQSYTGFVILHGSDTMAFTASALSFMLEGLNKAVILTGSQLPIGTIRTDGKENLITAIEIAATVNADGLSLIPEVAVYFEYQLYRGNRTHKYNSAHFEAFQSPNYPVLAEAGIQIQYNHSAIKAHTNQPLQLHTHFDNSVMIVKLFPGLSNQILEQIVSVASVKAIVLESYGSGNAPTNAAFLELIQKVIQRGVIVLNISQCQAGSVNQGKYETSVGLNELGVIGGADLTTEAAVTKLMHLLGTYSDSNEIKKKLTQNLRGELSA